MCDRPRSDRPPNGQESHGPRSRQGAPESRPHRRSDRVTVFVFRHSFLATRLRSRGFVASRQRFGRRALAQAPSSAALARYASCPPWRAISRLTVEGARFSAAAIVRIDRPAAIPREISSRSTRLSAHGARRRGIGAMPPRATTTLRMTALRRFSARPMARSVVPAFRLRQISSFSGSNTQRLS